MAQLTTECFVGIDAGTTGVTVAVFGSDGTQFGSGYREYSCVYPHPGWVEQDMGEVWRGICLAARDAMAEADPAPGRVRSVAFSSQRGSFVLLDADERPLGRAVVWNDSRAHEMEAVIAGRIDRDRYRRITGTPLSASWAAAKIAWIARHAPERMARTRWICNGQEYFLRQLGAETLETDPASLTLNGMMDIRHLDWSDEVLAAAGIDRALLPPVGAPGKVLGRLSRAAAEATGLPEGIPVCRGAGDQQCAAIGAGVVRQGFAEITIGTAAMMVAHLDHPDLVTGDAPYIGGHGVPGKWDLEGGAFAIGSSLRWWRDTFGQAEVAAARQRGVSPYDLIVAQALESPPGARGAIFHPFFAGQVTPYYDATARAGFLGIGLHHDRSCLIRAMLEGCACEMRLMVESFDRDLKGGITDLALTGGGTRSRAFTQIIANVLHRPIRLPANGECTVLGAAILGAVAVGAFTDVSEAVGAMVHDKAVVDPEPAVGELYDALFSTFRDVFEDARNAGVYETMYGYQTRFF